MASSRTAYGDLCQKVDALSIEKDYTRADSSRVLKKLSSRAMCALVRSEGARSDGRDLKTVRPIDVDMSPLPTAHGSVVFTRGETQSLATCTLGDQSMQLRVDDALEPHDVAHAHCAVTLSRAAVDDGLDVYTATPLLLEEDPDTAHVRGVAPLQRARRCGDACTLHADGVTQPRPSRSGGGLFTSSISLPSRERSASTINNMYYMHSVERMRPLSECY